MKAAQHGDRDDAAPALGLLLQRRCLLGDRLPDALMRAVYRQLAGAGFRAAQTPWSEEGGCHSRPLLPTAIFHRLVSDIA